MQREDCYNWKFNAFSLPHVYFVHRLKLDEFKKKSVAFMAGFNFNYQSPVHNFLVAHIVLTLGWN